MKVPRVFCTRLGADLELDPQDQRHLRQVLRLKAGDQFLASDGQGQDFLAELTERQARVLEERTNAAEPGLPVWLLVALAKGERFERLLEKATELGVAGIIPVLTRFGVVKDPGDQRQQRWQRLVREAAALAGRARIPSVVPPVSFAKALEHPAGQRLLFTQGARGGLGPGGESARDGSSSSVAVMIGPEGGFAPEERAEAASQGWLEAGLGPRNLRVETAATAALALVLWRGGELGSGAKGSPDDLPLPR